MLHWRPDEVEEILLSFINHHNAFSNCGLEWEVSGIWKSPIGSVPGASETRAELVINVVSLFYQ